MRSVAFKGSFQIEKRSDLNIQNAKPSYGLHAETHRTQLTIRDSPGNNKEVEMQRRLTDHRSLSKVLHTDRP